MSQSEKHTAVTMIEERGESTVHHVETALRTLEQKQDTEFTAGETEELRSFRNLHWWIKSFSHCVSHLLVLLNNMSESSSAEEEDDDKIIS